MKKRILVIDDDPFHVNVIEERIRRRWSRVDFDFKSITNEKEFKRLVESVAGIDFDLVIIDQMIPYTSQDDTDCEDLAALKLDAFRGGTRCFDALRSRPNTEETPVIFYTILDHETVPSGVPYVKKTGDLELNDLLENVAKEIPQLDPQRT